jgi:hypothetical protein
MPSGDRAGEAKWMPFQQALAKADQQACDRMLAYAKSRLQAEVQLRRPWGFAVVVMAALLASQKRLEEFFRRLDEMHAGRKGDHPQRGI